MVPDFVEALQDGHSVRRRVQRNNRARLRVVQLVPHAVVVGQHERIHGVARQGEGAVDLDRHRELAQQDEQPRAFALEVLGFVQRDEDAVRAAGDEKVAQRVITEARGNRFDVDVIETVWLDNPPANSISPSKTCAAGTASA